MTKTIALIAATAASLIATAVPAAAQGRGSFDPITLAHRPASGDYCIRTGWGLATNYANRLIRSGDCHDEREWRRRGVMIDTQDVAVAVRTQPMEVASR
ncbi:hypothetical protein ACFSC3_00550 [Sphingomonas floccifaciens]|uniref:Uncharacterized protein n=1 Tax=Sphingomonas floccifaciens TaxID=1844115 RepID=A0ABW4N843_9SPHN